MQTRRRERTLYLCQAACIAALYVILTLLSSVLGLASGAVQIRLSEMLCLLPIFLPAAIPGISIGCLLANLLTGAVWLDVLVGPVATLIGALGTYWLRKYRWIAPVPPVLSNAILVPFVLAYGYGVEQAIGWMMLTVGLGEILSIYVLGMLLMRALTPVWERK